MHDIGRRNGVSAVRHIIDGYDYAASKGWNEVARVCLTHSFPVRDIGKKDITAAQYAFIDHFLHTIQYDDYDKSIILYDTLADANGFCILKKDLWIPQGGTASIRFPLTVGIVLTNIKLILNKKSGNPYIHCYPILKNVYMINLVFSVFDTYNKNEKIYWVVKLCVQKAY